MKPQVLKTIHPFQVGECDIVAACSPEQAKVILAEQCDYTADEMEDFEVEYLGDNLSMIVYFECDEDGERSKTLGELMPDLSSPAYLFGWE